jgi:hypothetical protein
MLRIIQLGSTVGVLDIASLGNAWVGSAVWSLQTQTELSG